MWLLELFVLENSLSTIVLFNRLNYVDLETAIILEMTTSTYQLIISFDEFILDFGLWHILLCEIDTDYYYIFKQLFLLLILQQNSHHCRMELDFIGVVLEEIALEGLDGQYSFLMYAVGLFD